MAVDAVDSPAMLRGPDPDRFRTSHYGARWYIDPLPADDTWPATQEKWPAVSTIKKAWSKPFRKKLPTGDTVPLDAYWAAEFTVDNIEAISALEEDKPAAMALICGAGARALNRASDRGIGVHTVLEDLAGGKDPLLSPVDAAVQPYVGACRQFIHDWRPRWLAAEFVVINRTLGFGGTGDAIIAVDIPGHGTFVGLTDWKSRGGKHGCYEEEVAQIGGYSLADYIVVNGPDGRPVRTELPRLDGGFVVSINPSGYELYPVGLEEARSAFRSMHVSWREHREGQKVARKARGNPLIPSTLTSADLGRIAWLRSRVTAIAAHPEAAETLAGMWSQRPEIPIFPNGGPTTTEEIDAIAAMCELTEMAHELAFSASDPAIPQPTKSERKASA